ncbi:MAG: ornithine decarboxylase [Bacteroidia bacterium]|nr:beta-eliminating lyase-related protein [Bacteroidia bacterium]MDW8159679.1 ornithine decarboxylase [Bacteroidia bacterium]
MQNVSTASSSYLVSHYNASQLRTDTWNRLKHKALLLNEIYKNAQKKKNLLLEVITKVKEYLNILEQVENYFAFPGKERFSDIKKLFEREDYRLFAHRVVKIVNILFSEGYRQVPAWQIRLDDDSLAASFSVGQHSTAAINRHYFEVLYVANFTLEEEKDIRARLLAMQQEITDFFYDIVFVPSFEDALIAINFNYNIQSCVIHYGFNLKSSMPLGQLRDYFNIEEEEEWINDKFSMEYSSRLGKVLHRFRPELDLYLITEALVEDFATFDTHQSFRRVFYGKENFLELHLSILRGIDERYETPFFNALKAYSQRPTGVFHAMPISRGNSVFRSHWIQDMGHFYGTNIFLAETSATTGGLDSLLQPTGPLKKAQERAAYAFGAQYTFFVTNGTSTANKIVVQALVQPGDIVLIDRDCHKSHHYGLVLSGAYPIYLDSYPVQQYCLYGAVPLTEIKRKLLTLKREGLLDKVKVLLLTNSTFDGIVYHVEKVMLEVLAIKPDMVFLWDEAWWGFARFVPTYRQRTAMHAASTILEKLQSSEYRANYLLYKQKLEELESQPGWNKEEWMINNPLLPDPDKVRIRVYATQSTHKTLTSLRQGAMIHIYDQDFKLKVEDAFHEAYMTHTSTSPNYQILASLDIARRQVELEGYEMVQKCIENAMSIREKLKLHPTIRQMFTLLGPKDMIPEIYRPSKIEYYYDPELGWGKMYEAWKQDEFVLDPTHITLFTGKAGIDGNLFKNEYLMNRYSVQVNKTSINSVLFMTNIGTSRSAVAFLISVLSKIARSLVIEQSQFSREEQAVHQKRVEQLTHNLPPLPDFSSFHPAFRPYENISAGDIRKAYFLAFQEDNCEYIPITEALYAVENEQTLVSAYFVIPYPPGFPILVPGQVITYEILSFLKALDVKEIHGYKPEIGLKIFKEKVLAEYISSEKVTNGQANRHITLG